MVFQINLKLINCIKARIYNIYHVLRSCFITCGVQFKIMFPKITQDFTMIENCSFNLSAILIHKNVFFFHLT